MGTLSNSTPGLGSRRNPIRLSVTPACHDGVRRFPHSLSIGALGDAMPPSLVSIACVPTSRTWALPMTSEELVAMLAAVPGARRVRVDAPLTAALLVAGVEVAATHPATERTLRKLWRERRGNGATPLLLV